MCQLNNLILNYERTYILTRLEKGDLGAQYGLDDYKTSREDDWKIAVDRLNLKDNLPESNSKTDHRPCLHEALHSSVVISDNAW